MQPNERLSVLCSILKLLSAVAVGQGLFWMTKGMNFMAVGFLVSALICYFSWKQYFYFGCLLNQIYNLIVVGQLLIEMAVKLENGLYATYFSLEGVFKMANLVWCFIAIYFHFYAYQNYKQLAFQMFVFQNDMQILQKTNEFHHL